MSRIFPGYVAPLALAALFLIHVAVWMIGDGAVYNAHISWTVMGPGPFVFLDTHAVVAALDCANRGMDVIVTNPCDVWNRVHVYSPLWLALSGTNLTTAHTTMVGFVLALCFLGAVFLLPPANSWRQAAMMTVAYVAPSITLLVERGNVDIVVFCLAALAASAMHAQPRRRYWGYMLVVLAALLKFYPVVLIALVVREKLGRALWIGALCLAAIGLFTWVEFDRLSIIVRNIHTLSSPDILSVSMGAPALPMGLMKLMPLRSLLRWSVVGVVGAIGLGSCIWVLTNGKLREQIGALPESESIFLLTGGLLFLSCFITANSPPYRAVFLLFLIAPLYRLALDSKYMAATFATAVLAPWAWLLPISESGLRFTMWDLIGWLAVQTFWWWLAGTILALTILLVFQSAAMRSFLDLWPGRQRVTA
jgi:hypothetical protein